jgi:uncharacterized protein with FMN-binding domain
MSAFTRAASVTVAATALLCAAAAAGPAQASMWSLLSGSSGDASQASPAASKKLPRIAKQVDANGQPVPFQDGQFPGKTYDAYYGLLQVQANISGGQLVSVDVLQYPKDRRTSRYINSQALPILQQEVVTAQNTQVDMVSGATLTSEAFLKSLGSALSQASN